MAQLKDILNAAAKLDGKGVAATGEIHITVSPASFKSDGRGRYTKDEIVRQVRVGRLNVSAYALEAIFAAFGVQPDPTVYATFLALPDGN